MFLKELESMNENFLILNILVNFIKRINEFNFQLKMTFKIVVMIMS